MKRLLLTMAAASTLIFSAIGLMALPASVYADPTSTVCNTLGSGTDCSQQPADGISLNNIVTAVVNILSVVIGIVAVVMIMVSGFRYITSGGDSSKVASAKSTMVYAIIGLVIVALAQFIVQFVLNHLNSPTCKSGTKLSTATNKCVPIPKASAGTPVYYYAVADKHYRLNYRLS